MNSTSYRILSVQALATSAGLGVLLALSGCGGGSATPTVPSSAPSSSPSSQTYTLGGSVSGLPTSASGLVLANGSTTLSVAGGATTFSFPTALASGTAYAVTVQTNPTGLTCTVAGGSGTLTANTSNIVVTCAAQAFTVGGTIALAAGSSAGVSVTGLVLANGADTLAVPTGATTFTMPTPVAFNSSYQVTVKTQPTGMSCAVNPAVPATMPANNVTSVVVTCTDQPYALTGTVTVTGAAAGVAVSDQGLVLTNSSNGDTFTLSANAATFTMPKSVAYGAPYAVTATTQPVNLTCAVSNGTGTMPAAAVALTVTCADQAYSLGGTVTINSPNGVTGLSDQGLVLTNTGNGDTFTFTSNAASFTMPMAVPYGSPYAITVTTQPTGLSCSVIDPSTTMPGSAVANVAVTCSDQTFALGGTISGLGAASGLILGNNGANLTTILANATTFTLTNQVPYGAAYSISVIQNPTGRSCTPSMNTGTMPAAAVATVATSCVPIALTPLHSFAGGVADGSGPLYTTPILATDGNLYGLTPTGGTDNQGVLYKLNPTTGVYTVLYSFLNNGTDGYDPEGSLIQGSDGNLYAVTNNGGANYSGAIIMWNLTTSTESVLYSFGAHPNDGTFPIENLIQAADGNFYGLTYTGNGTAVNGALFQFDPVAGTETVLYQFAGSPGDGAGPIGSLIQASDGNFYGVTDHGGATGGPTGDGTIFEYNTQTNVETVLHSFSSNSTTPSADGGNPTANLIQATDGNLYGTTVYGGTLNLGTIFEWNLTTAAESVTYAFTGGADGQYPYGGLIEAPDGNLYGLTFQGGGAPNAGALVEYNLHTGSEAVQYSFLGTTNGAGPKGNLLQGPNGNFYGVTNTGGANNLGVIFKIN